MARVRRVQAPRPAADRTEGAELVRRRGTLGRVLEPGRESPGALLERLLEVPLHRRELVARRRPVLEPHGRQPELAVRDEARDVHRRPGGLEALEVAGRIAPGEGQRRRVPVDRPLREGRIRDREAAVAAVPDDLGGDALVEGADRARVDEQGVVGVAVDVDEAGDDVEAGGVDLRRGRGDLADRDDALAGNADIGGDRRPAGAVDHAAVPDRDVDAHAAPRSVAVAASSTRGGSSTTTTP